MAQDLGSRPWYKDWPPNVPKIVDFPNIGLGQMLKETAAKYPGDKAIVFQDSVMTYGELDDKVNRFATALAGLGFARGDVLALILPNSPQFVVAFYACQRLGVTVTAINPTYKGLEIKHQLNDSGAKGLVVLDAVFGEAARVLDQTKVKHLIGTNIADLMRLPAWKKWLGKKLGKIPFADMPSHALKFTKMVATAPNVRQVEVNPAEDVAALIYTGGTTGTPKGAMLTHQNLVSNAYMGKAWIGEDFPRDAGWVGVLPLFHSFALTCVMDTALCRGGFMLLFPKPPDSMAEWAAQIEKWGQGTQLCMPGVAVLFNKINNTPGLEKFDLSPLTKCLSGAGPLPRDVQLKFEQKFGSQVVEGYGLTESSPVTHANPFVGERKLGSIGLPFPNTDVKIMDLETGSKELGYGPDQVGELCVKGPQVMKGYFNRPVETSATIRDGWLYTGDVAYMDEDGWTFIMDRAKDLVKHKGYSVFPKEIEDYLFSHPDILEVAVVGLPHPKVGEILKAFVVLKPESQGKVSEQDIIDWCKENMTHYKVPNEVQFRAELPKTMVGKVLRRVLKEEELAKSDQK
ncbi:MAG: long-chain fatty acid--CoA ligase [Deltaproteobacteria bacterium]|nr:long-chain fatty acid--CoA ligase [Deltaproteobacteria bacterium]